jgi:mono/diheme cytochrome c family protein
MKRITIGLSLYLRKSAGMPPFDYLDDEDIWQLVIYLRSLVDHE